MQTDDFDSEKFAQFGREKYESLVRSTDAFETDLIVIEPGIDAIYAELWSYIRLTEWDCGLKRVTTKRLGKIQENGFHVILAFLHDHCGGYRQASTFTARLCHMQVSVGSPYTAGGK